MVPAQCIMKVPFPHPGFMRDVYPGFLQLGGFMSMNLDRHVSAHRDLFRHLVQATAIPPTSTATSMTNISP
jgi:poly-beta-hydroxyalkanoate depolymerase